jgi:hypothetical protein
LILALGVIASAGLLFLAGRSLWMWLNGVDRSGLAAVLEVMATVAVITAVWSLDVADPPSVRTELFPVLGFVVAYFADATSIIAGVGAWLLGIAWGESCFREHGAQLLLVSATPMRLIWGHSALMTLLGKIPPTPV